ncbi:hypothetical protein [Salimicrobium flavidum]|uniref:Yip1 domain-containing protein n=1 Tax=Salimicrobium flavidum TaxID=570947 RepID=A0A1N7K5T6_9BACI|nr:hypothetical protein [Salimicrobium flavidum]SIS56951.1 hypothetical protein SAMN05421687_10940 [Salimicrobium flavidum]
MIYSVNLWKLFWKRDEELWKLSQAEKIRNVWNMLFFLVLASILTFVWTAWIGLGTDPVSANMIELNRLEYEWRKAWFGLGRIGYALLFSGFILFFSTLIFWLFNTASYKRIMVMQMNVLLVMLLERITWIPLLTYAGLDWFVSPLSFGVVTSYFTDITWVIYFFGAISLFQLFIIWYQISSLKKISSTRPVWIWIGVILWHLILWAGAAALSYFDIALVYLLR